MNAINQREFLRPHAARVPLGNRLRLRRGCARVAALERRLLRAAGRSAVGRTSPIRSRPSRRCCRPRPRASSSCSCTAARATSTRSTTSPTLIGMDGKTIAVKTFGRGGHKNEGRIVEPRWKFQQYGQCGKWVSDLFPHLGDCVDDIAFLHSMTAESPIHGSAMLHDELGQAPQRQPVPRLVGQLRPGQRQREPARLRRDARPDRRADQRGQELVERLHAGHATRARCSAPTARRSSISHLPAGMTRAAAARPARHAARE